MDSGSIDYLIQKAKKLGAGDLHLVPGTSPIARVNDRFIHLSKEPLSSDKIINLLHSINEDLFFSPNRDLNLYDVGDIDCGYTTANGVRVRVNAFLSASGVNAAIRIFRANIPTLPELGIPFSVRLLAQKSSGLILFSGPTGNGKTTSIAAMLQSINESAEKRIVTIEDPIEYTFPAGKSIISQREVRKHCRSFLDGLHAALREDPDIIVVGEIRNADSVQAVINAAESGHLVFSTLHGGNVIEAIDRIAQYFPNDQHSIIRAQLANCFEGIICQRLFPRKDGAGRIAAFEVLLSTPATKALVRDNPAELPGYMFARFGMGVMDDSIKELKHKNLI